MLTPYPLKTIDNLSFEFVTHAGITYKIYFLKASHLFADYQQIKCPVYEINFIPIDGNPFNNISDQKIGATIQLVLSLFFENIRNVAIYVCESLDNRQIARKRKFDAWFDLYNNGSFIKENGTAYIDGDIIFNSILIHKQNEQIHELIRAFRDLNEKIDRK